MSKSVHPDVKRFKTFVKNNSYVLKDVKSGEKTLQDLFEEFILFGEEDDIWESYKEDNEKEGKNEADEELEEDEKEEGSSSSKETVNVKSLIETVKKMNMNDLQKNLAQFSGVLGSVQELLLQFKQSDGQGPASNSQSTDQQSPFTFQDD